MSSAPRTPRTIGHWFLLLLAIFFAVQFFIFFVAALQRGVNPSGWRFVSHAVAVFVTALLAAVWFAQKSSNPGLLFIGLLLLQPAAGRIADRIGGQPKSLIVPLVAAALGVAALVAAIAPSRNEPVA